MLKSMGVQSTNFEFLRASDERLARLAGDAERYFASDASADLVKLRAMGERMVRLVAAHQALSFNLDVSFDDVLRALRSRGPLPQRVSEILYHVKRVGNAADDGASAEGPRTLPRHIPAG